ncbi:MAG TPA: EAL domain-containing protein, partial [Blastocatellia bacterium]|nr:EAL domain-containing protein [Blastocatellia bacterium]
FPFDVLKVDKSFVMRLGHDTGSIKIVKTILMLAAELEMYAVAEGIETEEQAAQLRALNCTYGQGYLYSKPLPAKNIEEMLSKKYAQSMLGTDELILIEGVKDLTSTYPM